MQIELQSPEVAKMMATLDQQWNTAGPWNLPYLVLLLGKLIDRITANHVKETAGLSLAEWRAIAQIKELQPCSAAQIANRALVDQAEVSRALRNLEKRGVISRQRHPRNKKSSLVSLTEFGEEMRVAIRGERDEFYQQWVTDLDDQDKASIDAGLRSIAKRIVSIAPQVIENKF